MRSARLLAALVVLALLGGCGAVQRRETATTAPPAWLAAPAVWRIRQVVLIELGEMKFPVQGLLELDTAAGSVRLAALDDFGVTLFRLTVTRSGERVDFVLPLVPRGDEVTRSVAASLRQIYLRPGAGDVSFETAPDGTVAAAGPRANGSWRVWYDDYRDVGGVPVPQVIRFQQRGGASLTIRQETVKRVGE